MITKNPKLQRSFSADLRDELLIMMEILHLRYMIIHITLNLGMIGKVKNLSKVPRQMKNRAHGMVG